MLKRYTVIPSILLSSTLLLTGCGGKEKQKEYDGLKKSDTTNVQKPKTEQPTTEQPTTESKPTDDKSIDKVLDKESSDDDFKKKSDTYIMNDVPRTSQDESFINKVKSLPNDKLEEYRKISEKPRSADNLNDTQKLEGIFMPNRNQPESKAVTDKVANKVKKSYVESIEKGIKDKNMNAMQVVGDKYFDGEAVLQPYYSFAKAGFDINDGIKVVKGKRSGESDFSVPMKTMKGETGAMLYGTYYADHDYIKLNDYALLDAGKPYFDYDVFREIVLYDQGGSTNG